MTARERLDEIKKQLDVKTDAELAEILDTNKLNIDSWVKRNKIPEKWELFIRQIPYKSSVAIGDHNVQITGEGNIVSGVVDTQYAELFELIKNYATPKIIKDLKEKLLKIKEIYES